MFWYFQVEETALSQIPSGTRVSTSDNRIGINGPTNVQQDLTKDEELEIDINDQGLRSVKVLVLGLDGSGKTSMLNLLASKMNSEPYVPTTGFNAVQVGKEDLELNIVEGESHADLQMARNRWLFL